MAGKLVGAIGAFIKSRRGRATPDEGTGEKSMGAMEQPRPGDDDFVGPVRRRDKLGGALRRGRAGFAARRKKFGAGGLLGQYGKKKAG